MNVLVDTSVWSRALRWKTAAEMEAIELSKLIEQGTVEIIGPIRQELLSGISRSKQFELLKSDLSAFEDFPLKQRHFEVAAEFFNQCRKHGVQGSHTDFLICSVASLENMAIYTSDHDFIAYKKWLPIRLYETTKN